ncbi:MAG: hypothetical protein ACXVA8_13625, partial [Bdellovibrionota bacterium]
VEFHSGRLLIPARRAIAGGAGGAKTLDHSLVGVHLPAVHGSVLFCLLCGGVLVFRFQLLCPVIGLLLFFLVFGFVILGHLHQFADATSRKAIAYGKSFSRKQ